MNLRLLTVPASVVLAYAATILTSYAWLGILVSLPLFWLKPLRSFLLGLLIALISSFSLYLLYPASALVSMANILGSVAGLSPFLALSIYPALFSLITASSAAMWSEIYKKYTQKGSPRVQPAGLA